MALQLTHLEVVSFCIAGGETVIQTWDKKEITVSCSFDVLFLSIEEQKKHPYIKKEKKKKK